jgi:hypothetical protein
MIWNNNCIYTKPLIHILKSNIMPTKTNKNTAAAAASRTPEAESALKELFVDEIFTGRRSIWLPHCPK